MNMKEIILPEIVAAGIYNASLAVKNREITKNRKTTMFEIELPIESGGVSYIDRESSNIAEDIIICAKPGQLRHTRLPFSCYYIHIIVKEGELYDMLSQIPSYIKVDNPSAFEKIYKDICRYYDTGLYSDRVMLQSLVLKVIYMLYKNATLLASQNRLKVNNSESIKRVISYIKDNLTADLSLEAIAQYASFSPIHFHNCFKAATGKTLREYVEEQRLKKAINLLVNTDLNLSKIAYECGFSSQSYFSYAFKKRMNMTPRAYAKGVIERYGRET